MLKERKGLTLVELLIAIGIVAVLIIIALKVVPKIVEQNYINTAINNLNRLISVANMNANTSKGYTYINTEQDLYNYSMTPESMKATVGATDVAYLANIWKGGVQVRGSLLDAGFKYSGIKNTTICVAIIEALIKAGIDTNDIYLGAGAPDEETARSTNLVYAASATNEGSFTTGTQLGTTSPSQACSTAFGSGKIVAVGFKVKS